MVNQYSHVTASNGGFHSNATVPECAYVMNLNKLKFQTQSSRACDQPNTVTDEKVAQIHRPGQ